MPQRAAAVLACLAGLMPLSTGCHSGAGAGTPRAAQATTGVTTGVHATGSGAQTISSPPRADGQSGDGTSAGSFTAAFAKCMRDNGVPNFPDPDGSGTQLGPNSGIDPTSAAFQSAVNGPCKSLAPPSWLSSGPVNNGGGS